VVPEHCVALVAQVLQVLVVVLQPLPPQVSTWRWPLTQRCSWLFWQTVLLAAGGNEQVPVCALQLLLLSTVQGLLSLQVTAAPVRLQLPFWQVSAPLQALPSPQLVPLAALECTQPACAVQVSLVQALLSLQLSPAQLNAQFPPPWHP
jgi:hypothetical protein